MKKLFDNTSKVVGLALAAFSIIGLISRYAEVGLRGIFADLFAFYHSIAEAVFRYVLAWPLSLIWPDFDVPAYVVDLSVGLFVITIMGSRVIAGHAMASMDELPAPALNRWMARITFAALIYLISVVMTVTLIGPVRTLYGIFKGAAFVLGWPKWATIVSANDAELVTLYKRTFWAAVATTAFVLVFFALNAYAPGEITRF